MLLSTPCSCAPTSAPICSSSPATLPPHRPELVDDLQPDDDPDETCPDCGQLADDCTCPLPPGFDEDAPVAFLIVYPLASGKGVC